MTLPILLLLVADFFSTESLADFDVYPSIMELENNDSTIKLHIHENLTLNLEKSSVLAKEFFLTSSTGIDSLSAILNGHDLEESLYYDKEHKSTIVVNMLYDGLEVRGVLNHEQIIYPVETSSRSNESVILHRVVQLQGKHHASIEEGETAEIMARSLEDETTSRSGPTNRTRKDRPNRFIVEVCFVVSSDYTSAFNTTQELIQYLAVFLNAAALRFIDMTFPKLRFVLKEVITDKGDEISKSTKNRLDAKVVLKKMRALVNGTAFSHCDIAYYLTSKDVVIYEDKVIRRAVKGVAYIGGVCSKLKVGLGEDIPHTYGGVYTLAHEMGHLLGADHDNTSANINITGYPGAEKCPWKDGYLMSDWDGGKNKYRLSNCSKEQIRFMYRMLPTSCIQTSGKINYTTELYPGHNLTRRKFCQLAHWDATSAKPEYKRHSRHRECKIVCCYYMEEDEFRWRSCDQHDMPEGLSCAPGKTCRRGVCAKHDWKRKKPRAKRAKDSL